MYTLQPSFDPAVQSFIEIETEVVKALATIHPSLTIQLIREVVLAANEKIQHVGGFFPLNSILPMWQSNITGFLREQLCLLGWTKVDGLGGVAYVISPCKEHAIRVFAGDKYVGLKEGNVSNKATKGSTLEDDISPLVGFNQGTVIWTLLHYKSNEVMKLEISQPKSIVKGKINDWSLRIKLPDIKFNVPTTSKMKDKYEVGTIPVTRKKTG